MIKLLNSAMMPAPGQYRLEKITKDRFCKILQKLSFESYIGYPETAKIIEEESGVHIEVNRKQTKVKNGDYLLIAKLTFRPRAEFKRKKGQGLNINDFEFFICTYTHNNER